MSPECTLTTLSGRLDSNQRPPAPKPELRIAKKRPPIVSGRNPWACSRFSAVVAGWGSAQLQIRYANARERGPLRATVRTELAGG